MPAALAAGSYDADKVDRARAGLHELRCLVQQLINVRLVETVTPRVQLKVGLDTKDNKTL